MYWQETVGVNFFHQNTSSRLNYLCGLQIIWLYLPIFWDVCHSSSMEGNMFHCHIEQLHLKMQQQCIFSELWSFWIILRFITVVMKTVDRYLMTWGNKPKLLITLFLKCWYVLLTYANTSLFLWPLKTLILIFQIRSVCIYLNFFAVMDTIEIPC